MKYLPLMWAGLWRKRVRTVLTLLSVVTAFLLYGILSGVTAGFDHAVDRYADATRLRVQNRINITAPLPIAYRQRIESVDGVQAVLPINFLPGYYREPANGLTAIGLDIEHLAALTEDIIVPAEQIKAMKHQRDGAIVGPELLEEYGWHVGDRVTVKSSIYSQHDGSDAWPFEIVGSYTLREGAFPENNDFFMNYDYFDQARVRGAGSASMYMVRIADAGRAAPIAEAIDALFRNSPDETLTQSDKDYIHAQIDRIGNINYIVNAIVGAVLFTLLFLTGNTMMQSIRERIPELAVLKTYGFGDAAVTALVIGESLLLCLTAAAVGLGIAAAAFPAAFDSMGVAPLPLEPSVIAEGAAVAVVLALVSALPPVWRARRLNLVDALAGR
jgi:putative ABC transport system permease protein